MVDPVPSPPSPTPPEPPTLPDSFGTDILRLIFNGVAIDNLATDTPTSPATSLTVALHTSDPGETGNQSTNEISYTGYSRIAVARSTAGWAVMAGFPSVVSPVSNVSFGVMAGGSGGTVTHFSVGTGISNKLLYSGIVTPNVVVVNGVVPLLTVESRIMEP